MATITPIFDSLIVRANIEADLGSRSSLLQIAKAALLVDYTFAFLYFYVSKYRVKPHVFEFENNVLNRNPNRFLRSILNKSGHYIVLLKIVYDQYDYSMPSEGPWPVSTPRKYQSRRSASRIRSAGLAVVVLALMQISVASHQFEHLAEDASNTCRVCAQQDRFDGCDKRRYWVRNSLHDLFVTGRDLRQ